MPDCDDADDSGDDRDTDNRARGEGDPPQPAGTPSGERLVLPEPLELSIHLGDQRSGLFPLSEAALEGGLQRLSPSAGPWGSCS